MNELFSLRLCGKESTGVLGGTAPYEVILNKQCTVKELRYKITGAEVN